MTLTPTERDLLDAELRFRELEFKADWQEGDHPRADDGKFGSGGAAAKPTATAPSKSSVPPSRVARQNPNADTRKLQKKAPLLVDAAVQRYCEEHNEAHVAQKLGGASLRDSEPVDIQIPAQRVKHGIELKTLVTNKRGTVRMSQAARERKASWETETGATVHTLVFDDRLVYDALGEGEHDTTKRAIYYRRGVGNLSISAMHPCKSMAEVKRLMNMKVEDLPDAAKPLSAKEIKAWLDWVLGDESESETETF